VTEIEHNRGDRRTADEVLYGIESVGVEAAEK